MNEILTLIYLNALIAGVNPHLAISVAMIESGLDPSAIGQKGDTGLFQVRHELVKESFYDLLNPEVNIKVGLRVLNHARKECSELSDNHWLTCYNRGPSGARKMKDLTKDKYYKKVMKTYNCLKNYNFKELTRNNDVVKVCSF